MNPLAMQAGARTFGVGWYVVVPLALKGNGNSRSLRDDNEERKGGIVRAFDG